MSYTQTAHIRQIRKNELDMAISEVFFVLLVGLSTCYSFDQCPPKENVRSCTCYRMAYGLKTYCHWSDLEMNMIQFREHYTHKKNIDLKVSFTSRYVPIKIPSKIFAGLDIKSMELSEGNITSWSDELGGPAFVGLEDTLESLLLKSLMNIPEKNNHKNDVAWMTLGHLHKLRDLRMFGNRFFKFNDEYLKGGLNSLESLDLAHNRIRIIGDNAFADLPRLMKIELENNGIEQLKRSMFPNPAPYLHEITSLGNELKELPEDMFSNMPSLIRIDLQANKLKYIRQEVWSPVWSNLEYASFSANPIICDAHIKWMFEVRPPKYIFGRCSSPRERENARLEKMIEEHRKEFDMAEV